MNSQQKQNSGSQMNEKPSETKRKKPFDWSESTIVVNGLPFTVIFPDEEPLPYSSN